jgi:hypothetical protein
MHNALVFATGCNAFGSATCSLSRPLMDPFCRADTVTHYA